MTAATSETVSDSVTARIRTGRGGQVAFLRYGRLAFLTLISTTVEVTGADEVSSRRYQPRTLRGSAGCRENPSQRFVSDPVTKSVRYFRDAAAQLLAAGWELLPDNSRTPGRHVHLHLGSQYVLDVIGAMPDADHFTCEVRSRDALFTLGLDPADTVEVLVDQQFPRRRDGTGERWAVTATKFSLLAAGQAGAGVRTRHQFRPVTSRWDMQFVALGNQLLLHREWVPTADLPAVTADAFTAAAATAGQPITTPKPGDR